MKNKLHDRKSSKTSKTAQGRSAKKRTSKNKTNRSAKSKRNQGNLNRRNDCNCEDAERGDFSTKSRAGSQGITAHGNQDGCFRFTEKQKRALHGQTR